MLLRVDGTNLLTLGQCKCAPPACRSGPPRTDSRLKDSLVTLGNLSMSPGKCSLLTRRTWGSRTSSCPRKKSKHAPYTDEEKVFVKRHRLHRAKVEHAIARLHRFRIFWHSAHREKFTGDAIRFIVWCEHIVMSNRFGYKNGERMQPQFVTAPCPCGFESKTKILKREQASSANATAATTPRAVARRRQCDGGGEE